MGLKNLMECPQCKRAVDGLYEVGWTKGGEFVIFGRTCFDCAGILKEKLDQMQRNIMSAKLN